MKIALFASLSAAAWLHVAPTLAAPAAYEIRTVDYPGAPQTLIAALNDFGDMVGYTTDASGNTHAVVWRNGHPALVDPSGVVGKSAGGHAYSINTLGTIAGSYTDAGGVLHGYVLGTDGKLAAVDDPNGLPTEAYGVNDLDQVIGVFYTADGNLHAFELSGGTYKTEDVPGSLTTVPLSINDRGEIVGYYLTVAGTIGQGYVRSPSGAFTTYDAPGAPANSTFLISANNTGEIVGGFADASGDVQNILLVGGVSGHLDDLDLPASFGSTYTSFQTINDLGSIVGFYYDASGNSHGFLATPQLF